MPDLKMLDESGYFVYFLKTQDLDNACIFLKDNHCTVHDSKPRACRLYPFMVEPNESGQHRYLYSTERKHHFRGPAVETRAWMKKYLPSEDREFLTVDYSGARPIAKLLRSIPEGIKHRRFCTFTGCDIRNMTWMSHFWISSGETRRKLWPS